MPTITSTDAQQAAVSPVRPDQADDANRLLYLTGRPTLRRFVRYVKDHAVDPPHAGDLTERWKRAEQCVARLAASEAGAADHAPIEKLGPEYEPLLIELLGDPLIRNGFNTVPTEIAFVDLDRLVVYQPHI